jgi:hypothetical protein
MIFYLIPCTATFLGLSFFLIHVIEKPTRTSVGYQWMTMNLKRTQEGAGGRSLVLRVATHCVVETLPPQLLMDLEISGYEL